MKAFFEEYGLAMLEAICILLLVCMLSPIGSGISNSIHKVVRDTGSGDDSIVMKQKDKTDEKIAELMGGTTEADDGTRFYSSFDAVLPDINALSTENADSTEDDAMFSLKIEDDTAYLTVLKNQESGYTTRTINSNIVIEGNNHEVLDNLKINSENCVIQNLKGKDNAIEIYESSKKALLDNIDYTNTKVNAYHIVFFKGAEIEMKNCKLLSNRTSSAAPVTCFCSEIDKEQTINIHDCTIEHKGGVPGYAGTTIKINSNNYSNPKLKGIFIKNNKISADYGSNNNTIWTYYPSGSISLTGTKDSTIEIENNEIYALKGAMAGVTFRENGTVSNETFNASNIRVSYNRFFATNYYINQAFYFIGSSGSPQGGSPAAIGTGNTMENVYQP